VVIGRQAERSESTKARILVVARDLFVRRGYAAVPAEDLVREAGLTRGALYHHFGGKEGLFAALYEQVQREVTDRIDAAADGAADAWSALRIGCHTFLESCLDPVVQQVVLLDAPVVLGWEAWREVDARYGLGSLKEGLHHARESGAIAGQPLDAAGLPDVALFEETAETNTGKTPAAHASAPKFGRNSKIFPVADQTCPPGLDNTEKGPVGFAQENSNCYSIHTFTFGISSSGGSNYGSPLLFKELDGWQLHTKRTRVWRRKKKRPRPKRKRAGPTPFWTVIPI
jgi:AcrR family transcriptional regulator